MENNWKLSTQQIQIFLKAVELKNFRMVADFYNFTPSTVSKTIQSLEEELGVALFVRGPHELTPTPVAKELAGEWRLLLGSINNSIIRARKHNNSERPRIQLGFVDSSEKLDESMKKLLREYKKMHPNIDVVVEKHDMHRAAELLNNGMLDLIYSSVTEVPYIMEHNLKWERVLDTNVVAYVPVDSPLFERKGLKLEDLRDAELVALDPMMHPTYRDWLYELCGTNGFSPNVMSTYRTVRSLKFSLTLNPYIFIGENITSEWGDEELKCFVLPNKSFTIFAWRTNERKEVIDFKDFLNNKLKEL